MLPKLQLPEYKTILPVSGKEIKFRPYTVREEKTLLLAKESKDFQAIIRASAALIEACAGIDASKTAIADIEWLFIQLRIKAVGEISNLSYKCVNDIEGKECGGVINTSIDLREIGLNKEDVSEKIEIGEGGIKFNSPSYVDSNLAIAADEPDEYAFMYDCLDYVWDKEEVTSKADITLEEFKDWLGDLDSMTYAKIENFFEHTPNLYKKLDLKCPKCGNASEIELEGLEDFF